MEKTSRHFLTLVKKFYIKLYLHKKNRDESSDLSTLKNAITIQDASRSWDSLSPEYKEIFIEQFKKRGTNHKAKVANYLKTASPKQIKKICKSQVKNVQNINQADDHTNKTIEDIPNLDVSETLETINEFSNQFSTPEIPDAGGSGVVANNVSVPDITQIWPKPVNPLPEPPTALNARQLFDLVNNKNSEDYQPWESLAPINKRRYKDAVLKIKKAYLKKYELYLQNLTCEELYDHMIDVISDTLTIEE